VPLGDQSTPAKCAQACSMHGRGCKVFIWRSITDETAAESPGVYETSATVGVRCQMVTISTASQCEVFGLESGGAGAFGDGFNTYELRGAANPDLRVPAMRAFQRLWNRARPTDMAAVDGSYGSETGQSWGQRRISRWGQYMDEAPAGGFSSGSGSGGAVGRRRAAPGDACESEFFQDSDVEECQAWCADNHCGWCKCKACSICSSGTAVWTTPSAWLNDGLRPQLNFDMTTDVVEGVAPITVGSRSTTCQMQHTMASARRLAEGDACSKQDACGGKAYSADFEGT
jgi:hypothetical protein